MVGRKGDASPRVPRGGYAPAARDAYAMSHLSAVNLACTHGLAGCRPTRGTLTAGRGTGIGLQQQHIAAT